MRLAAHDNPSHDDAPAESPAPRSARTEFVDVAVAYLLGQRGKSDGATGDGGAVARTTSARGGTAMREPARPSASALGIRLVAELTGRSHAAPLFHFPDRLCLVAAVAAEGFRRQTQRVREAATESSTEHAHEPATERLQRCAFAYVQWASGAPALFATMYDPELAPVLEAFMMFGDDEARIGEQLPTQFGGDGKPARRRYHAYCELYEAKQHAIDTFVAIAREGIHDGSLRSDLSAHDVAHVVTSVADGLAWQHVTEQQSIGPLLEAHTRRMIRLCFEGVQEPAR